MRTLLFLAVLALALCPAAAAETIVEAKPEPAAREALDRGLAWLAKNQGETHNWGSKGTALSWYYTATLFNLEARISRIDADEMLVRHVPFGVEAPRIGLPLLLSATSA